MFIGYTFRVGYIYRANCTLHYTILQYTTLYYNTYTLHYCTLSIIVLDPPTDSYTVLHSFIPLKTILYMSYTYLPTHSLSSYTFLLFCPLSTTSYHTFQTFSFFSIHPTLSYSFLHFPTLTAFNGALTLHPPTYQPRHIPTHTIRPPNILSTVTIFYCDTSTM